MLTLFKNVVLRYKFVLWLALGALTLGGIMYGLYALHQNGVEQGRAEIKMAWEKANQTQLKDQLEREKEARDKEKTLTANMAAFQKKANHEKTVSDARLRTLLSQLRQRPERTPSQLTGELPPASGSNSGCTGAGLARPDAEFLAGYAADAARLQSALDQCTGSYESVRSINESSE